MQHFVSCMFFFFKQKTAYEMRISDWSSDVCSSYLGVSAVSDPVNLSYEEFTEARPSASRGSGNGANSLAGTYSDSIREFLNLLTGRGERGADADDDDGWLAMSDETDGSSDADVEPDNTDATDNIGRASGRERVMQYD